jgi:short-subunit dehydrogenase
MKIAITGHTSGIGKGMYDHFLNQNHEVFGLSRSNGFDISKNTKEIVEISEECDLFINNAYSGDSQLKLLMLLK